MNFSSHDNEDLGHDQVSSQTGRSGALKIAAEPFSADDLKSDIDEDSLYSFIESKNLMRMVSFPKPGSILFLLGSARFTKANMEIFLRKHFLKEILFSLGSDDTSFPTYIISRFVLPHSAALTLAEMVTTESKTRSVTEYEVMSELFGEKFVQRSDIFRVIKKIATKYPKIIDLLPADLMFG